MIDINVLSEEGAWSNRLKKKEQFFRDICKAFPKKYRFFNKRISLTLLLSNNKNIKRLNKNFRNKNKSTDILSFPFYKKKDLTKTIKNKKQIYLGDIIINLDKIKEKNDNTKFQIEFDKLWLHGLLHLFGYKHLRNKDFKKMNNLEKRYFNYIK